MGSYGGIKFDSLSICDSKSYIPDDWAVLFQESDRRTDVRLHEDADAEEDLYAFIWYEADRDTFLWRLNLLGATDAAMRHAYNAWITREREDWTRYATEWSDDSGARAKALLAGLETLDFDNWKVHASQAINTRYNIKYPYEPKTPIEQKFHDLQADYIHFAGYGDLITLRALLEACADAKAVKLDISQLVASGYYLETDEICAQARRNMPNNQSNGPTVILGEGSTDILVLRHALKAMHPSLVDYFSFFDHSEFNVDGGAAYLVKFLKAFAAAKVTGRFVAIFDNDAAGVQAFEQAKSLKLPANFLLTTLPDIDLARSYPTLGPSGLANLDVNGLACGIELYLGRQALTHQVELRPVRWAGYVQAAKKYQGEVEGKNDILAAFLQQLENAETPNDARAAFPELEQVWQLIFHLAEMSAGEQYLSRYEILIADRD